MTTAKTFEGWYATRLDAWKGRFLSDDPYSMEAAFEAGRALGTHEGRKSGIEEVALYMDERQHLKYDADNVRALTQTPKQEGDKSLLDPDPKQGST